jgi:hypothetical protein
MNARSLNVIAGEINRIDRARIFNIGDLFLEARDACEHANGGNGSITSSRGRRTQPRDTWPWPGSRPNSANCGI